MDSEEILKVSRELIGSVSPVADSYYDEKIKNNADKSYDIISGLIADIGYMTSDNYYSPYASAEDCAKNGYRILKNLRTEIDEYLEEIEE